MSDKNNDIKTKDSISVLTIASTYVGVMIGAGFASGRECWQFFGVFGTSGYAGIAIYFVLALALAFMVSYIAASKGTADLGALISPFENEFFKKIIGYVMAAVYYTLIIAMTSAAGALLNQVFGLDRKIGGAILAVLVIFTVLGDFERVSGILSKVVPVVILLSVVVIVLVLTHGFEQSGAVSGFSPSSLASTLPFSAIIFSSYNGIGMISMAGNSSIRSGDSKKTYAGAFLGCAVLAGLTLLLFMALWQDAAYSDSLDLPMLGFAARISSVLSMIYAIALFASMFSTASSTYYAFTTVIPDRSWKKYVVIAGVVLGYIGGLTDFKTIVEYLYPVQGYIGIVFYLLILINWIKEFTKNKNGIQ